MPMADIYIIREVPPYDTKGNGMPVGGMDEVTTPIWIKVWIVIKDTIPEASNVPNKSSTFKAVLIPLQISKKNNNITVKAPKKPNSSPIIANIKSL